MRRERGEAPCDSHLAEQGEDTRPRRTVCLDTAPARTGHCLSSSRGSGAMPVFPVPAPNPPTARPALECPRDLHTRSSRRNHGVDAAASDLRHCAGWTLCGIPFRSHLVLMLQTEKYGSGVTCPPTGQEGAGGGSTAHDCPTSVSLLRSHD